MSAREDAIRYAWTSEGGLHIQKMLDDMISEPRSELAHIMATAPDKLTGKVALKYAIRAKALEDFCESITDAIKISEPSTRRGRE